MTLSHFIAAGDAGVPAAPAAASPVVAGVVAVLVLVGAVIVFLTSIAVYRAPDAVTRVNALSPATALGIPLVVVGGYVYTTATEGFTIWGLARLLITLAALLLVSSVASNALARATVLSGAEIHPRTQPNDLATCPHGEMSE